MAGNNPVSDTTNTENDVEIIKEADEKKLSSMAKVHKILKMLHVTPNLCATQKESCAHNRKVTAVAYISDTEEIVKVSWSLFQHGGVTAFKLSERSPLPPALSAKDLPGGRTQILNVR